MSHLPPEDNIIYQTMLYILPTKKLLSILSSCVSSILINVLYTLSIILVLLWGQGVTFETRSYGYQNGLIFVVFLPQPPMYQTRKHAPLYRTCHSFLLFSLFQFVVVVVLCVGVFVLRQDLTMLPWLARNLPFRPGWSQTQRDLSASAS